MVHIVTISTTTTGGWTGVCVFVCLGWYCKKKTISSKNNSDYIKYRWNVNKWTVSPTKTVVLIL